MNKLLIVVCLVLSACASPTLAPVQQGGEGGRGAGSEQGSQNLSANTVQSGVLSQAEIDAQALAARTAQDLQSVYFDYGTSEIRPEGSKAILQQVDFMKSHAGMQVTLEGNTDERGSNEFNLALADTRANAVKKLMLVSGIEATRINTVSFGEEKPRLTCHEERCWKENRRVDFVYKVN